MSAVPTALPRLLHVANLWSLWDSPDAANPWPPERQIEAVKEAGFDGFTTWPEREHVDLAKRHGLFIVGYFATGDASQFERCLAHHRDAGVTHINVQLADHDTPTEEAVRLAVALIEEGQRLGVQPAVEVHRDTCTETPEKTYALADGYHAATGELLPMTWDFSHLAVVKHLAPPYSERLLVRPDLVRRAQQFHFRPFNGHHCQVPVTDGKGGLTPEVKAWLPFVEDTFCLWRQGEQSGREIFVVPELGPLGGGYNLSTLPNSWEDAKVLRSLLAEAWERSSHT